VSDSASNALQAAVEAQVVAGAPGALARVEVPRVGLSWTGSAGRLSRGDSRALRPDDAFRVASVTKSVTAAVAIRLAGDGWLALDEPLADQLAPQLLHRWSALGALARTTPRQLLTHTSGVPNYFTDAAFLARLRVEPDRAWRPVELVDHAAEHGTPPFLPGHGFQYSDTGYVITGILVEQVMGRPLHQVYRDLVFDPLGMDRTWLEGHEPARTQEAASHYSGELDWTTVSPTIDWAGGGLVTTASDLARYVRGLWSGRVVGSSGLEEMTRWTPGASFPPGYRLRYDRYGLGMGAITLGGVELLGHTGFIGAFAFYAPHQDGVLVGTHNDSKVDRWPLVTALCQELADAA
jgi:CubicO group peptidase (beta-lactamase class C family)